MFGLEDKLLAVLFSLSILAISAYTRIATRTFLVPASIFSLFWFTFTITPLILLFNAPINPLAILYIAAAALVFSLSATPFNWEYAIQKNSTKQEFKARFDTPFLSSTIYASVITAIILSITTMMINGFSINQIFFDLIKTSGRYAEVRVTDGIEYGIVGILSMLFTYLPPVLGGLRSQDKRSKFFFALTMAPSLLTMVIQSSKIVFLVSLCFYIAGAIIARIYSHKLDFPRPASITRLITTTALLSSLVLISFISRLGEIELKSIEANSDPLLFSIASYTLGQVYAFADFFSFTIGAPSLSAYKEDYYSLGAYTFNSIFCALGMCKDFPTGMYEETVWFSNVFETNIFTVFRGLIYDFGIAGSLIFVFALGLFTHYITYIILVRNRSWICVVTAISILVFILMGYLFSVFVARYVFFTASVLWLLLQINDRMHQPLKK